MYVTRPDRRDHGDDVGGVLHQGAEAGFALGEHDAGLVRLVDQSGDAPGDTERGDAGDRGEHEGGARSRVVEEHDRGCREQRGPEHDHPGAPVPDEPGIGPFPERAHRRVHDRGGEEEVRDRPHRVERAAVGVGTVGDETRVQRVGDEHQRETGEQQPRGRRPPGQREHRVHDDHDQQDVHQRIGDGDDPFEGRPVRALDHRGDHPLPDDRRERDRDDAAVEQRLAVES